MKKHDKGITLLELVLSIAISVIVLGMAIVFVNQAIKYYNKATGTLAIQSETQVLMEQVGEWIQQANRVELISSGGTEVLLLWNIPTTTTSTTENATEQYATKRAVWLSEDNKLYTQSWDDITMDEVESTEASSIIIVASSDHLLGEYVTEFDVEITYNESGTTGQVSLSIGMESSGMTYSTKDSFTLRNLLQ